MPPLLFPAGKGPADRGHWSGVGPRWIPNGIPGQHYDVAEGEVQIQNTREDIREREV